MLRSFGKGKGSNDFPRLYSRPGAQLKNSFELLPSTNRRASMYTRCNERERPGVVIVVAALVVIVVGLLTLRVYSRYRRARARNIGANKTNVRGYRGRGGNIEIS